MAANPATFLARALAVRALRKGPLPCNLRTGRVLHPELARRAEAAPALAALIVLAAGLWLVAVNVGWQLLTSQRAARLQRAIAAVARQVAPVAATAAGSEVLVAQRARAEERAQVQPILDLYSRSLADRLAAVLAAGRDCGLAIEQLTISDSGLALQGSAPSGAQLERAVRQFTAAGCHVVVERKPPGPGGRVLFSVRPPGSTR